MKFRLFLLFALAITVHMQANGQNSCDNDHIMFNVPKDKTPKVITKLGTSPQFLPIRHLDNKDEVYAKMSKLSKDPKYKKEIDAIFRSLGYTGTDDPRFTKDKLTEAKVPFGAIGMLGDGAHHYLYCLIAVPGHQYEKGWRVKAINGKCDAHFMRECGNAFFYSSEAPQVTVVHDTVEKVVTREITIETFGSAKMELKVYARNIEPDYHDQYGAHTCPQEEKLLLADDMIVEIPVVEEGEELPERALYIDVDRATYKKLKANMVNSGSGCCGATCCR